VKCNAFLVTVTCDGVIQIYSIVIRYNCHRINTLTTVPPSSVYTGYFSCSGHSPF